jgi:hypothetical protein
VLFLKNESKLLNIIMCGSVDNVTINVAVILEKTRGEGPWKTTTNTMNSFMTQCEMFYIYFCGVDRLLAECLMALSISPVTVNTPPAMAQSLAKKCAKGVLTWLISSMKAERS